MRGFFVTTAIVLMAVFFISSCGGEMGSYKSTTEFNDLDNDGWTTSDGDCDDSDSLIYPGSEELCDGYDNDCDSGTPDGVDEDWYRNTEENCSDGLDNNCDGDIDEEDADCIPGCTDIDGDGYAIEGGDCGSIDCNDSNAITYPGADEICDSADNDCDGRLPLNEADTDNDGWMICEGDCDDGDTGVNPGAVESNQADNCRDGLDNDCDGLVDDQDPVCADECTDGDGDGFAAEGGDCGTVDCDDGDADVHPGAVEFCDGDDNDCDPSTADGTGEGWLGDACDGPDLDLCEEGVLACVGGVLICTDETGDNLDLCNGLDDDCNPETVDGVDEYWFGVDCYDPYSGQESGWLDCIDGNETWVNETGDDGSNQITLAWRPPSSGPIVNGSMVHYGTVSIEDDDFPGYYQNSVDVLDYTCAVISKDILDPGQIYYFTSTAYNDCGESDFSDEVSYDMPPEMP